MDGRGTDGAANVEPGRSVTLRIRCAPRVLSQESEATAHVAVDLAGQLGADTLIHGHFGHDRHDLTLRLPGIQSPAAGETIPVAIAPAHLHLFDPDSGARL